jgi:hypothetical protein
MNNYLKSLDFNGDSEDNLYPSVTYLGRNHRRLSGVYQVHTVRGPIAYHPFKKSI